MKKRLDVKYVRTESQQTIETIITDSKVTLTDKVLYFPCSSLRPKIEYPAYLIYDNSDVLVLPYENQPQIERNFLEGLLKIHKPSELYRLNEHLKTHKDLIETRILELMYQFYV